MYGILYLHALSLHRCRTSRNRNAKKNVKEGFLYMNEMLEKILEEDKDFTEAKFKAKVDNMYIQIFTAIMKQDLIRVKHFFIR